MFTDDDDDDDNDDDNDDGDDNDDNVQESPFVDADSCSDLVSPSPIESKAPLIAGFTSSEIVREGEICSQLNNCRQNAQTLEVETTSRSHLSHQGQVSSSFLADC